MIIPSIIESLLFKNRHLLGHLVEGTGCQQPLTLHCGSEEEKVSKTTVLIFTNISSSNIFTIDTTSIDHKRI